MPIIRPFTALLLTGSLLAMATSPLYAAETLYIQSRQAALFSAPHFDSNKLLVLPQGAAVMPLEDQPQWVKVQVNEKIGWLSKYLLANHPPLEQPASPLEKSSIDLSGSARIGASTVTTAGAARGLKEDGSESIGTALSIDGTQPVEQLKEEIKQESSRYKQLFNGLIDKK